MAKLIKLGLKIFFIKNSIKKKKMGGHKTFQYQLKKKKN